MNIAMHLAQQAVRHAANNPSNLYAQQQVRMWAQQLTIFNQAAAAAQQTAQPVQQQADRCDRRVATRVRSLSHPAGLARTLKFPRQTLSDCFSQATLRSHGLQPCCADPPQPSTKLMFAVEATVKRVFCDSAKCTNSFRSSLTIASANVHWLSIR